MTEIAALESLLFVAGEDGLSLNEISALLDISPQQAQYDLLVLAQSLKGNDQSGIQLVVVAEKYQLVTKSEYSEVIRQYAVSPYAAKLSQAALETLAIVAYRQPVTRLEIDDIRGVQSANMLKKLMNYGLIDEVGRKEAPGRPILYGVTDYFYQYFGLSSLSDLPDLSDLVSQDDQEEQDLYRQTPDEASESSVNSSQEEE